MKRILVLRLPNWPIARLVAERRALSGSPVALFSRNARGGEPITACSIEAEQLGVRIGMPRIEAASLGTASRRVKFVHLELHNPDADRKALEKLARWCERWSPLVGLESSPAPQCLLLDITGLAPLFGTEELLIQQAKEGIKQQGYSVLAAVAGTIGAAWADAWFREYFSAGERNVSLEELPLAALRLQPETLALLYELGLERIGQVLDLPRAALATRFGSESIGLNKEHESLLLRRLDQLTGATPEIIQPYRPPPDWQVSWPLEHSTARRDLLELVCERLIALLVEQLDERQRAVARLECRLEIVVGKPVVLSLSLCQPTAVASHLLDVLRLKLERLSLPGPVRGVALQAVETVSCAERQLELFADSSRHDERQLAWLLDRLSGRLGVDAVISPQSRGDPLPERAFRHAPHVESRSPKPARQASGTTPKKRKPAKPVVPRSLAIGPLHRPVWMPGPQAIEVISLSPDGPPLRFVWNGKVQTIHQHWGPERIESGWWRGRHVARDYYRVETETSERYWLFRRLSDGSWWLHGIFG